MFWDFSESIIHCQSTIGSAENLSKKWIQQGLDKCEKEIRLYAL